MTLVDCKVHFLPLDKSVEVSPGTTLLEAAGKAGIAVKNLCGGGGVCGRCRMIIKEGKTGGDSGLTLTPEELEQGTVLSCLATVESDLSVEIPETTRAGDQLEVNSEATRFKADSPGITHREFDDNPLVKKIFAHLDPPTLESNFADLERIELFVEKEGGIASTRAGLDMLREIPGTLRESAFKVTVTVGRRDGDSEIISVESGDTTASSYMVVVDVGTTTVVAHLVDTATMTTLSSDASFNSQSVYGREVTARIMAAEKKGVGALQEQVVEDINRLIEALAEKAGIKTSDISAAICAGNTTMMHFLLKLPADNIRREPFIAAAAGPSTMYASETGISIHPRGLLYVVPGIGSWVGGDLTAGILATGLHEKEEISMLIDVGTNGEIIVGNSDWLMACSASTGPALEGASVDCGMMGEKGAIERVYIEDDKVCYKVIGGGEAEGICGSGIIDLVAVLLDSKVIDRSGKFIEGSDLCISEVKSEKRYTLKGTEIYISASDIENIITAKAAVFAATKIMLDRLELSFDDVSRLFIAGGFGNFIDIKNAIKIGLLPGLPLAKIQYAGNTSLWGAKLAALSTEAHDELYRIQTMTTYFDLMGCNDYVEQFGQAQFLPHTDVAMFNVGE